MKKILNLLVAVVIVSFLASCGGSDSKDSNDSKDTTTKVNTKEEVKKEETSTSIDSKLLIGEWKIEDFKTSVPVPEDQKADYEKTIKRMKESSLVTFSSDGTILTVMPEKKAKATWRVEDNKLFSKAVSINGKEIKEEKESVQNIEMLTNNKAILTDTNENGVTTTITLVK